MPWKHNGIIIKEGKGWSDKSYIQHPSNWASVWSDSEKLAHDMQWEDPPASYDDRFYFSAGVERNLEDSSDGTIGLKTQYINEIKQTAFSLLSQTDWHITRKAEDDKKTIPSKITKYRSDIRTASETIENKIKAANNMTAFKKLFDSADADGITDINRWPEEV